MNDFKTTEIRLTSRPAGWPGNENFELATVENRSLGENQVRVRNEFISVDPYMRGRMNDTRSYVAPYQLGERITGGAVGRVVESSAAELPEGSVVTHQHGWSDGIQADAKTFKKVLEIPGVPLSVFLHILGMTGMTAFVGLKEIVELKEGETVFISGAAGAVGTAAGQIAKLMGAKRVIGSAGSAEKVALLTQKYGYDVAFNYKDGDVRGQLANAAPQGIDVFFDNVGGEHLEAALSEFNDGGRAALCGAISSYNVTEVSEGPKNMANLITRGLKLQGFTLANYLYLASEFNEKMSQWFADGKIAYDETIVEGIENTADAFVGMMKGANIGKMLVRI